MKKILLLLVLAFVTQLTLKAQISTITLTAPFECWVTVINDAETTGQQYGWWDTWHKKKKNLQFAIASSDNNFTVTLPVKSGGNTVIIYNKSASASSSDGIVLENININGQANLKYTYQAGDFKDWNCLSCPWLYVFDGNNFVRKCEIIKDIVGIENQETNLYKLENSAIIDGKLRICIQEEKEETSFLDRIALKVNGKFYEPQIKQAIHKTALAGIDNKYLNLTKGESLEIEFIIPTDIEVKTVELQASGYYIPSKAFLAEVYNRILLVRD